MSRSLRGFLVLLLVACAIGLGGSNAHAKDLYLTVTRDFSPSENPQVQVDFKSDVPMQFRVLAPLDQKGFIAEQVDLKRAWRAPKSRLNPARFLLRGFNWSLGRFAWLRRSLDPALREKLFEVLGGNSNPEKTTALPVGPKKIISSPEQFKVVQEFWLHPNDQDEKSTWDVPGFTDDETIYGATRSRILAVPNLAPGFYVLQVVQGGLEGQVVLVVNDLFAQLQQSSNQALVRVADRKGEPVAGAAIELRSLQGKWVKSAKTDTSGVVKLDGVSDNDLITVVQDGARGTAIIDSEFYPSTAVLPDLYLYTDRPMYRPGDQVSFRGLTRGESTRSDSSTLEQVLGALEKRLLALRKNIGMFKGQEVLVNVTDASGQSVGAPEVRAQVGEFGTFEGQFTVPGDIEKSGPLRITARLAEAGDFQGEIRVKNYIKPEFMVKVSKTADTIRAGTRLEAEVRLERYAGGIPAVQKVRAELIRERVSTPEWISDAGMGETGSGTYYGSNANARGGQTSLLPVVVWSESDIAVQDGRASIEFEVTDAMIKQDNYNYSYRLVVHADESGKYAQGSTLFYDLKSEVVTQTRFVPILVKPGDKAWLEVRSLSPGGSVLGDIKGKARVIRTDASGKEFQEGSLDVRTNAQGRARLDVPVKGPGRVSVQVTLKDRSGAENIGVAEVLAMATDSKSAPVSVPELELLSQNTQARVGETARILALLPAGWAGAGREQGNIYITVAGGMIHDARVQKVQGTAAWIDIPVTEAFGTQAHVLVSYPGTRGWVEKRLSILIPPIESLLVVQVDPLQKEAFPGGEQEVDITVRTPDGKPVKSEVSLSVVDRKVLDLQPEFRPGVERFFYPPQALNLMSFQSTDFQAYGWGELIARQFRSNYGFAATKEAMSSALKEQDTAFWVARAQTDLNGKTRLKFRLPANQTFWVTSALATDREGRVGEGRAEFRARMPLQFLVNHPRGLRPGERALVRVKLSNPKTDGLPAGTPIKYHLSAVSGVSLESAVAFEGTLKPGEEKELSTTAALSIADASASQDPRARFASELELGAQKIFFEHDMDVLPARVTRVERTRMESGKPISWNQPATAQIQEAEIVAASGLSGTLLGSTDWMERYPHGCVEQFTSKLVVLALASRFGISNAALLSEPELKRFQAAGKIVSESAPSLKKYKKSWGFSWFPDGAEADPAMSMLVGLLLVSDPDVYHGVGSTVTDEISTLSWRLSDLDFSADSDSVDAQRPIITDAAKVFLSAVSRYLSARSSSLKSEKIRDWALNGVVSQLKQVASQAQGENHALARAFLVLAIREYGAKVIQEVGGILPSLESQVKADLARLLKDAGSGAPTDRTLAVYWPSAPVGALAVMGAAVEGSLQKDGALFSKFKQALLSGFNGEMYGSTFQTAIVLSFSTWLMDLEVKERKALGAGKAGVAEAPRFLVDGAAVDATLVSFTPGIAGWSARLDPGLLAAGKHSLQVDAGSSGVAKLHLKLKQSIGISDMGALTGRYALKRDIYRMDPTTGAKTPLSGREIQAKVGDLISIEYSFDPRGEGAQGAAPGSFQSPSSPYFIIQDGLPSGLDILDESARYEAPPYSLPLGRAENIRRDVGRSSLKLQFNLENFNVTSGRVRLGAVARVVSAGEFAGGNAELEDFYDETGRSRTDSVQWKFSVK